MSRSELCKAYAIDGVSALKRCYDIAKVSEQLNTFHAQLDLELEHERGRML
jgi:hypothetical protein